MEGLQRPCKGANRSGAPVQKCKGERQLVSGGGWQPRVAGGGRCRTQRGTGDRMIGWGYMSAGDSPVSGLPLRAELFQVPGDGHGCRRLRRRPLGHQPREPGAGCRRLNGWRLKGRCPGGRHLSPVSVSPTANRSPPSAYFCTFAQAAGRLHFCTQDSTWCCPYPRQSLPRYSILNTRYSRLLLANGPTDQRVNSGVSLRSTEPLGLRASIPAYTLPRR
jgi:hypothetical protein